MHAELRRGTLKKHFVPVGITNRDKRVSFVPVARPGTKGFLLLSRHGVPGWETGTKKVSQPGQIKVFVVVPLAPRPKYNCMHCTVTNGRVKGDGSNPLSCGQAQDDNVLSAVLRNHF